MNAESLFSFLKKTALPTSLFLYSIAILTTMAGMEIFGWLTVLLILLVAVFERGEGTAVCRRPLLEAGDWALIALMLVIVLSAIIAAPSDADRVAIGGNARFVLLFLAMRFSLETVHDQQGMRRIESAFRFLIVLVGCISLYAIFQHFTGIDFIRGHRLPVSKYYYSEGFTYRARGMWGHPVTFGHSMALSFCLAFAFALMRKNFDRWKLVATAVTIVSGLSLIWSYTRGAWMAVAAAVAVMVLYLGRRIAVSIYALGATAILAAGAVSEQFRQRLLSVVSMTDVSNVQRMDVWKANIAMFFDHPILGVGYGMNEELITEYYQKLGINQEFGGHAHNNYLQFLSGTGILGFVAYSAFTIIFLWMSHRLLKTIPRTDEFSRTIALGALGAQVAMLVGGLTECNFKDAEVNHQFMFILAVLMMIWRQSKGRQIKANPAAV